MVTFKNRTPGPWLVDFSEIHELEQKIEQALTRPADLLTAIDDYNRELHPYSDGQSSARVVDAIEAFYCGEYRQLRAKPMNAVRKLKMRKALGYWGRSWAR